MAGHEKYGLTNEVLIILRIAKALRDEFGVGIDGHPGGFSSEAGVVNRAFRASALSILKAVVPTAENLEEVLSWMLKTAALSRLMEIGVVGQLAEAMLDTELGLGDAWPVYLALAPTSVVEDLTTTGSSPAETT